MSKEKDIYKMKLHEEITIGYQSIAKLKRKRL